MHPILFEWGHLEIRSYGLMLVISFIAGTVLACVRAKKVGIARGVMLDLAVLVFLAAIMGSRVLHIMENWSYYAAAPFRMLMLWEGGLSMMGGVVLALICGLFFVHRMGLSVSQVADIVAPSIALGVGLTRIGCFFNGCCFGKACELPWAVSFPLHSAAGQQFPHLLIHPTQLYSSLYGFAIFGVLLSVEKRSTGPGFVFGLFLLLYATARFLVDFVRYYDPSLIAFQLSGVLLTYNQMINMGLFVVGWLFILSTRRHPVQSLSG